MKLDELYLLMSFGGDGTTNGGDDNGGGSEPDPDDPNTIR